MILATIILSQYTHVTEEEEEEEESAMI